MASLGTKRLVLRPFTAADADNLFELDSDPDVMRYLSGGTPTPRDMIEHEILPRFMRISAQLPGFGYWAAIEKASGAFVGWFALHPPEGGSPEDVSLGYRLRKSAWGKGYATEGSRALIRTGFTELGVRRVFATTYQDNIASRRVMEKLGMVLVRTFRITATDLAATGTFHRTSQDVWDGDDVEYALEKADWERQETASGKKMDVLDRLLGHDYWTTRKLLLLSSDLSDAQLDRRFDIGHETLRRTFVHIIDNMEVWTDLLYERPVRPRAERASAPQSIPGLIDRLDAIAPEFAALARRVRDEVREDDCFVDVLDDPPRQKTFGGAIGHLITHSMHHRSEVLHILKRLGVRELPEGDLLSWEEAVRTRRA